MVFMEVSDIPLEYKLKFVYWADDEQLINIPSWWKSFLNNPNNLDNYSRREIVKQYAVVAGSPWKSNLNYITFHSHEHLTQFILKYC